MIIKCHINILKNRLGMIGYSVDDVADAIIKTDGDYVFYDLDSPAFPRNPKPGFTIGPQHKKAPPSLLQKTTNLATSAAAHVVAGMPKATQEQIDARYAICQGCEFFDGRACTKCGCPIVREKQFVSKLSWANEKCPAGKWGPVES